MLVRSKWLVKPKVTNINFQQQQKLVALNHKRLIEQYVVCPLCFIICRSSPNAMLNKAKINNIHNLATKIEMTITTYFETKFNKIDCCGTEEPSAESLQ